MNTKKLAYHTKYTLASYLDLLQTIPIETASLVAKTSQKILGENNPKFLSLEDIEKNSSVYKSRENLRNKLDTRPGSIFLQNNFLGTVPFLLAGIPAAMGGEHLVKEYMASAPLIAQYATNSAITLGAQILTGYTSFMALEVKSNKQKYVDENGKLSPKKIASGFKNAAKAFLSFDLTYAGLKIVGQSALLAAGKNAAVASVIFDSVAGPAWYTVAIPLSLEKGVIENKEYPKKENLETKIE